MSSLLKILIYHYCIYTPDAHGLKLGIFILKEGYDIMRTTKYALGI